MESPVTLISNKLSRTLSIAILQIFPSPNFSTLIKDKGKIDRSTWIVLNAPHFAGGLDGNSCKSNLS
nr:hypothetical protein [Pseudacidovorax intermedius]